MVAQNYRYCSEQVSHHPPITAYHFEGDGFDGNGTFEMRSTFKFGGGTGQFAFDQPDTWNFNFPKTGDRI